MEHKKVILRLLELAQELDKTDKQIECSMIVNDMEKLIDSYVTKQLNLYGVMPSLSQEIECVCGWEGKKGNLYYRERNKEFNIGAQLECPKCYTELVSEPN